MGNDLVILSQFQSVKSRNSWRGCNYTALGAKVEVDAVKSANVSC